MTEVLLQVENVANFTDSRDRESAASSMAGVLLQLFDATAVHIAKVVVSADETRRHTLAYCSNPETTNGNDSFAGAVPEDALLRDCPQMALCFERLESISGQDPFTGEDCIVVPLLTDLHQTILIELVRKPRWTQSCLRTVEAFAKIYRNFLNLLDYGERDALTGHLNRKSFDDTFFKETQHITNPSNLALEVDMRRRASGNYWIGVIDIDFFKKVNDKFGHLIGDEVLLLVANIIGKAFRSQDRIYRFGGEEFVVMLRAPDEVYAENAFERLRTMVESFIFPQAGQVTVSVGFSMICQGDTPAEAFDRADQAVYRAKQTGRNRVCKFDGLDGNTSTTMAKEKNDVELF
jgi:diguanylate cyclase (GGDEF)-like protein